MENKITQASLNFTCNQNWDAMEPVAEGRFCSTCQKKVYDLTNENVAYFVKILKENDNKICGRFSSDQLLSTPKPYWKRWLIAAMVFIGLNTAADKLVAQEKTMGKVAQKPEESDRHTTTLGIVIVSPDPLQLKALHARLVKNCKAPASVNGRVMASFTVGKNGVLENLAVSSHLGEKVRAEVLRVLKAEPRWKNAEEYYAHPYSLYLDFKKGKISAHPGL